MRVFTPDEVAAGNDSKYLGVLVAAKYARELNTLPADAMPLGEEKKLRPDRVPARQAPSQG